MRMNDTKGSMPFALIAVALLLASAALGAMVYQYGNANEGTDNIIDEIDSIDYAVADITEYVNRGLGEIVMQLSTASDDDTEETDTLDQRADRYREKAAKWIEFQFPIRSGGAVAHLKSYKTDLTAEAVQLESELDGYTPAYLRGSGSIDVTIESRTGKADVTLNISTDGSYALPLSEERLSIFKGMMSDGGISVSQMMSYQLTCLAQHRVMNGYGGVSQYGPKGTDSIITPEDVRRAYSNALDAISIICFKDRDNRFSGTDSVDLADLLTDGKIELDLGAVYAQALFAVIDDVALEWFDYFSGYQILDELDRIMNPFRNAISSLVAFIFGEERMYSVLPYIENVMELNGRDVSEYRFPGSGTTTVSAAGITVTVENPAFDIISAPWLKNFSKGYLQNTNFVMDFILDVLRGAAMSIADNQNLGTISTAVDPYDGIGYADTLAELFNKAVEDGMTTVGDAISESLSKAKVYDPFYGAIADEILDHKNEMVLSDQLTSRIVAAYQAAIPEDSEVTVEALVSTGALNEAIHSYRQKVISDLTIFDVLRQVEDDGSLVKTVLSEICAFGLDKLGITKHVPKMAKAMCDDILDSLEMNPHSGMVDLPGSADFRMDDGSGNITRESIDADVESSLIVGEVSVKKELCVHTVGFREDLSAAYSTVFTVEIEDLLNIRLTGSGALADAMGSSSSVIKDEVRTCTSIEVTVTSGWALAGIVYNQSDTLLNDLWNLLKDIFEPLIEPLRKIMESVRGVVTTISESLVEALSYVAEQLMRIYDAIYEPLEDLRDWIEGSIDRIFSEAALNVLFSIAMNEQSITFEFFGCTLEFSTKAITWNAKTKTLVEATMTMPVAGLVVTAGLLVKTRGEVNADNLIITGFGGVEGDDWNVEMTLDPLMKGSSHLITVDAEVGKTDISIVAPKLESYREIGMALSDLPGIGEAVSNIPIGGAKVGLDAGFSLKLSNPKKEGLVINEFESNPAGEDRGYEWVELYNNSMSAIDLTGYKLKAASDRKAKTMELSGTISPYEFLVIEPTFLLVNSSGKHTKNGEAVILVDPNGDEIDKTPTKKDGANDDNTWQRSYDGSPEWVFTKATQGETNGLYPGSSIISRDDVRDIIEKAVVRSFDVVESITDLETLETFVKSLVRYTLEGFISKFSNHIREASVYVSIDVSDLSSSVSTGVKIALRTDGELAKDVLKYLTGKLMEMALKAKNPYRIDPVAMFAENIDLEISFHTGIGFPKVLGKLVEDVNPPELDLGIVFRTNLSSLTRILGTDTGRPEVSFGVRFVHCPDEAMPGRLHANKNMDNDLWLMMVSVRFE